MLRPIPSENPGGRLAIENLKEGRDRGNTINVMLSLWRITERSNTNGIQRYPPLHIGIIGFRVVGKGGHPKVDPPVADHQYLLVLRVTQAASPAAHL